MAKWTQYTYINGKLAYEPHERSADRMVELMAQMHFLRQAGEQIEVHVKTDNNFNVVEYTATRNMKDKTAFYRFIMNS